MGRWMMLLLVLTKTLRTNPFEPGSALTTRPSGQEFLGAFSSIMTTRSPGVKFRLTLFHLCRNCINGRYSLIHRLQNRLARYCTCLHLLCEYRSSLWNSPGGMIGLVFNWSKWFGVRGSRSFGSFVTVEIGLSFMTASTSHKFVPLRHNRGPFSLILLTSPTLLRGVLLREGWTSKRFHFWEVFFGSCHFLELSQTPPTPSLHQWN